MNKIIEITDLNFPELDVYARLTEAQLRTRMETERGDICRARVPR